MNNLQALRVIKTIVDCQLTDETLQAACLPKQKAVSAGRAAALNNAQLLLKLEKVLNEARISQC